MPLRLCCVVVALSVSIASARPSVAQDSEEPTLPEVVVRPEDESVPPDVFSPPAAAPFDLPYSYPRLSEELFGQPGLDQQSIFDSPEEVTVRTRERLIEMAPSTTPQALQEEVGVVIQRTNLGGGSAFIRGLTGNQVLILIDGIRLNNSSFRYGPNQYLNTIDPGQIERIEVIRGPQSVRYGSDAIGGVINVVTRSASGIGCWSGVRPSFVQRFSSSDSGLYNRGNVEAVFRSSGVFAGGSYLDLDNLDGGGNIGRQLDTGYDQSAADLKYDYLLDNHHLLTVAVQHLVQHDVPRTDKFINSHEAFIFNPQERDLFYLRYQGLGLGGWIDGYQVTGSFDRQEEGRLRQKFGSTTQSRYFDDIQTSGVNLLFASDFGRLGRFLYGLDWYHDEVESTRENVDTATHVVTPARPQFPPDSTYDRLGVFLEDRVPVAGRLAATLGVRYTNIDAAATPLVGPSATPMHISPSFQDWTGHVGAVYECSEDLNLVASVSEGFRAPGLDDLTALTVTNQGVDVPSPDLRPETSWNYEVGVKFDFPRLRGQLFGFWTQLDDLIIRVPAGYQVEGLPAWVKRNAARARMDGLELTGEYLLEDGWSLYGNYMYVYGQNVSDGEPMSRIPPAQGIAGMRWRSECRRSWFEIYDWAVARQSRLSARDVDDPRILAGGTPGYHTLNLRAGRYFGEWGELSVGLENILDRAYRVHGSGIDAPGVTLTLGYELVR